MKVQELIDDIIPDFSLIEAVFSSPREKSSPKKITIKPVEIKTKKLYQASELKNNQVFHCNMSPDRCKNYLLEIIKMYKQSLFFTEDNDYHLLTDKGGNVKILKQAPSKKATDFRHNRQKQYLLPEGKPIPFLIELGLMNPSGKISPQKYDKFRQINRFLEMVEDVIEPLSHKKEIYVIDFGCGKAYLTFALYYYLSEIKKIKAIVKGIDLKEDVIAYCNQAAKKLGYKDLSFDYGSIMDYNPKSLVDMVVALHACDVATDEAIAQAVHWKAEVILVAPCCQHELNNQINNPLFNSLLRHGILKERMASLTTDAVRVEILETLGYAAQILEFIDSEHTPKNLLIRAIKGLSKVKQVQAKERYMILKDALHIQPTLEKLIEAE